MESNDLEKLHEWVKNMRISSGDSPALKWPLGASSGSESEFEGFFHPVTLCVHNLIPTTTEEDGVGFFSGVVQFVRFENVHDDEDEDKQEPPVSKIALMKLPSLEAT